MSTRLDCITAPLFVPGNRLERFAKAADSGADAIILDLEDAVAADEKETARENLIAGFTMLPVIVRINAGGTRWHEADLIAVLRQPFAAIMLPKAEAGEALACVLQTARKVGMPVVALIESARGLADARGIAGLPGVTRLAFGSIDYAADLSLAHSREALLAARSELVLAARLAGLAAPLDGITTSIDDAARITDDAHYARDLGFGGKLCIHPKQIKPTFDGFTPTRDEIAWASRVIASGEGAVGVEGMMVDEPVRIRARSILQRGRGK